MSTYRNNGPSIELSNSCVFLSGEIKSCKELAAEAKMEEAAVKKELDYFCDKKDPVIEKVAGKRGPKPKAEKATVSGERTPFTVDPAHYNGWSEEKLNLKMAELLPEMVQANGGQSFSKEDCIKHLTKDFKG